MKKTLRYLLIALLLGAAVTLFAGALCWYTSPASISYEPLWEEWELPLSDGVYYNCTVDEDGRWIPETNDPMVYFYFTYDPDYEFRPATVLLCLAEPLKTDTFVQVYFAGPDTELSESNSARQLMCAGSTELALDIPKQLYSLLRLDIDGEVRISRISAGFDSSVPIRAPYPLNLWKTLLWTGILGALIFVCLAFPRVKNACRRCCAAVLFPDTRHVAVEIVYAALAGLLLLHHVWVTLYYPEVSHGADLMLAVALPFAALSVLLGRMWKKTGFWILLAFWLLKYLRVYFTEPHNLAYANDYLALGMYAFFICFSVGCVLRPAVRRVFLQVFCAVWTVFVTVFCMIGLYALWNNLKIFNLGGGFLSFDVVRLHPVYHNIVAGVFIAVSAGVTVISLAMARNRVVRVLYLLALILQFITSGVTCARTGFGGIGVILAVSACLLLAKKTGKHGTPGVKSTRGWLRTAALCLVFLILFAGIFVSQIYVSDAFNAVRARGGLMITTALAEGNDTTVRIAHHGINTNLSVDRILSGRISLWKQILNDIFGNEDVILWGRSVYNPMRQVIADMVNAGVSPAGHSHNLWLQTALESGVPGLLLLVSVSACFLWHAVRLMKNRQLPFWQRLVPLPAIGALACEFADCTTYINYGYPQMTLLYLFMGLTIAFSLDTRKNMEKVP